MVGHDEALEARQVGVRTVPRHEERVGVDVADLEAVDRRQRAEFRVLDREQVPVTDRGRLVALRTDLGPATFGVEPLPVLPEPDLLVVGRARADQRITWK